MLRTSIYSSSPPPSTSNTSNPSNLAAPWQKLLPPICSPHHSRIFAHIRSFGDCRWSLVLCISAIEWNVNNARQSNSKQQSHVRSHQPRLLPLCLSLFPACLLACLLATTCTSLHSVARRLKRREKQKRKRNRKTATSKPGQAQNSAERKGSR
ncbi:hypothetical protein LY76DRAFT_83637 [Colletotrichum caudatum]|nr:hypothetical protein LY76DRAFT_83637 [Colletotrichum caudatum]